MKRPDKMYSRESEWTGMLNYTVGGLLIFETLTGLSMYLLPFSIPNQVQVILHTLAGLIFIIPSLIYMYRHWKIYRQLTMTHFKLTGYILMVLLVILSFTGILLTYESLFLTRINNSWDMLHTLATFALVAFYFSHVILIVIRDHHLARTEAVKAALSAQYSWIKKTLAVTFLLYLVTAAWSFLYIPVKWKNQFPSNYSYLYGKNKPFSPSLATTNTGGAFDPESLANSAGCGTTGCHKKIYEEWETSAHRYSAMDVAFQTIQGVMGQQNGPESTRYCGGCHDPISLFSGSKNIYNTKKDLTNVHGYQEGISCIACHSIKKTDVKGNANYVIVQPDRYMYELKKGSMAKLMSDFLIRSYPEKHILTFQHKLFKSPEFCAACHKQFIDKQVNNVGWVQLQNQYDKWRKSKWNHPGDPTKTMECRECHMPLEYGPDQPGAGDDLDYNRTPDDGKYRSHRFLAANQFMPEALKLPGAEKQTELTIKWLQGKIQIPEIASKWTKGPVVPVELVVPKQVNPGQDVKFSVILTNNKPGHDFPTGPIDIIQSWVEITVKDQDGNIVYKSGHTDKDHFIQPGSFVFKVEPVDQYGNLIDKHNLWEMVGVRFNRSMFPGFTDQAEFMFNCPSSVASEVRQDSSRDQFSFKIPSKKITRLDVTARLMYRKIDQFLINYLFGKNSGLTTPITVLSQDQKSIAVEPVRN